ncbi:MAG: hypothetical protein IRY83_14010 [Chloroflexi bacterium]|nr:hypothetical protein [Chloroflexota bacterium]
MPALGLLGLSALVFLFLAVHHDFVPMWIEGIAEYESALEVMAGLSPAQPPCWLHLGRASLPLAFTPYIGAAYFYAYLPPVYPWLHGLTGDPYLYRYVGITLFIADAWLVFLILRPYVGPGLAALGGALLLTTPTTLFMALTDHQSVYLPLGILLLAVFLGTRYLMTGRTRFLLLASLAAGATLLVRLETFVWPAVPTVLYLGLARPAPVRARWRELRRRPWLALLAAAAFALGGAPTLAYNAACPAGGLLPFLRGTILPTALGTAGGPGPAVRLLTRLQQFWTYNLLATWPWYELQAPDVLFAAAWLAAAAVLLTAAVRRRQPEPLLPGLAVVVVLSTATTGLLRDEHLTILQPFVGMVVVSAAALAHSPGTRRLARALLLLVVAGSVAASALDWRGWLSLPPTRLTMLNQSDPALLTHELLAHHARDRILYTNIGLPQYVRYFSRGRLAGTDITSQTSADRFADAVQAVLADGSARRVFVAVAPEHDGMVMDGALPRTRLLYAILAADRLPYRVTRLANARNAHLYDLITVDPGISLSARARTVPGIFIAAVAVNPITGPVLTAGVTGAGFAPGDVVVLDGRRSVPTVFGSSGWLTFSVPTADLPPGGTLTVEVLRPSTLEKSRPYPVRLPR